MSAEFCIVLIVEEIRTAKLSFAPFLQLQAVRDTHTQKPSHEATSGRAAPLPDRDLSLKYHPDKCEADDKKVIAFA